MAKRKNCTVVYCPGCGGHEPPGECRCERTSRLTTTYDERGMWTDQQRTALAFITAHDGVSVAQLEDAVNRKQTATVNDLRKLGLIYRDDYGNLVAVNPNTSEKS